MWSSCTGPLQTLDPEKLGGNVALAPAELLEMIRWACSIDHLCSSIKCGWAKAQISCAAFCHCKGEQYCNNVHTKSTIKHLDDDEDEDDNDEDNFEVDED